MAAHSPYHLPSANRYCHCRRFNFSIVNHSPCLTANASAARPSRGYRASTLTLISRVPSSVTGPTDPEQSRRRGLARRTPGTPRRPNPSPSSSTRPVAAPCGRDLAIANHPDPTDPHKGYGRWRAWASWKPSRYPELAKGLTGVGGNHLRKGGRSVSEMRTTRTDKSSGFTRSGFAGVVPTVKPRGLR